MLVATLVALLLAACGTAAETPDTASPPADASSGSAAFPRTLTGSDSVAVTLAARPARIVSLSPGMTEVLFAIGAGDQVAAVDRFSDFPAAAARLPRLEYSSPSAEGVLAARPDLVVMVSRQRQQVPQFRELRLPVLYLDEPASLDGVLRAVALMGEASGREAEARELVTTMTHRIEAVRTAIGGAGSGAPEGPRVFFELSPDLYTAGPETFIGSMLALLRARNIAQGATSPFPQLSAEAVLAADPEVILLADAESARQSIETVAARPGWARTSAVAARRVVALDSNLTNRPGPRIVDGLEAMARALYPERFAPAAGSGGSGVASGATAR